MLYLMSEVKIPVIGVAPEEFDEEVWAGVAGAYIRSAYRLPASEPVDAGRWYEMTAANVLAEADRHRAKFRLGSVMSIHSQLEVCAWDYTAIHFEFDHNMEDELALKRAERFWNVKSATIEQEFRDNVSEFLGHLGLDRTVVDCPHVWDIGGI
jgi:hypothetical protein